MKKNLILAFCLFFGAAVVSCGGSETEEESVNEESSETISEDDVENDTELEPQVSEDLDNATFNQYWLEKGGVLIDVRTPEEVADGAIDGSININYSNGDFEAALDTLDTTVPTFVYCHGGTRSGKARDLLIENGFLEVYNLTNGYGNWEE